MKHIKITTQIIIITFSAILLSACSPLESQNNSFLSLNDGAEQEKIEISEVLNEPSASLTVSSTITPTASSTPSPTPTPHPLNVEHMREVEYPGSEIIIEETLTPGYNYDQFITSYQSEGLKIHALLTVPRGTVPETGFPAIIFNHGYIPPDEYRTTERYVAYVDRLARQGYVIFRPDYRGHGFSEGNARGAYWSPDYTIDVLNALYSVSNLPDVDPNRIGMWGHSMGGHLTLRSMVISEDIKASVIWAGVAVSYEDMMTLWHVRTPEPGSPTAPPRSSWRNHYYDLYGTPDDNPEFWNGISPNHYLEDISGPVQLHHGTADETVPLVFSEILYDEMVQAGQYAEFYSYPGDNHNIAENFNLAMEKTIDFFEIHLKN